MLLNNLSSTLVGKTHQNSCTGYSQGWHHCLCLTRLSVKSHSRKPKSAPVRTRLAMNLSTKNVVHKRKGERKECEHYIDALVIKATTPRSALNGRGEEHVHHHQEEAGNPVPALVLGILIQHGSSPSLRLHLPSLQGYGRVPASVSSPGRYSRIQRV